MGPSPVTHAIQSTPILVIFLLIGLIEYVYVVLKRFLLEQPPSKLEIQLEAEVKSIEREAKDYDLPSTFMKWTALKRKGVKVERELIKMRQARIDASMTPWRRKVSKYMAFRNVITLVLVFFVLEAQIEPAPLLEFPSGWMFPFGRMLAIPNYSSGAVSAIGWSLLCQRFFARMLH